jgi:hypothetical protein
MDVLIANHSYINQYGERVPNVVVVRSVREGELVKVARTFLPEGTRYLITDESNLPTTPRDEWVYDESELTTGVI